MPFGTVLKNACRNPRLAIEAASWLAQKHLMRREPVRSHEGLEFSNFVDFSEFHSFTQAIDDRESRFLKTLAIGNGTVIDVGANIGVFSLVVAHCHPQGRIIAFEPGATTFAALRENVRRNAARVECHQLALAAHDGFVTFQMNENARANSSIVSGDRGISVPARRLDTLLDELGIREVALLKIDTEGHESTVLRGAEKLLAQIRPTTVYFEVCPPLTKLAGFDPAEPAHILTQAGYDLFELGEHDELIPVTAQDTYSRKLSNWIAKTRSSQN